MLKDQPFHVMRHVLVRCTQHRGNTHVRGNAAYRPAQMVQCWGHICSPQIVSLCCQPTQHLQTMLTLHAAAHSTPAASTTAAEPHRHAAAAAAEPHVPTQKELLAASLFGDNSSRPARPKRHPAHHAAPAHHPAPAQPSPVATSAAAAQPAAADLLMGLDSPGPTASAVPPASHGQHCPTWQMLRQLRAQELCCVEMYSAFVSSDRSHQPMMPCLQSHVSVMHELTERLVETFPQAACDYQLCI